MFYHGPMNTTSDEKRLRWHCRRGMLELDLLLLPFFDAQFSTLSGDDQAAFEELLTHTDPEIHSWLMGHITAPTPRIKHIVKVVTDYGQTDH